MGGTVSINSYFIEHIRYRTGSLDTQALQMYERQDRCESQ